MTQKTFLLTFGLIGIATLAACGGGGSEPKAPKANTSAGANTGAPATNGATTKAAAPAPTDVATVSGATFASFTGDAAKGEAVFAQCRTCHVTDPGANRIGPSLHSIVGRAAGRVAGFQYTPANANSGITWSPEKLFQYLENPQRVVPGTKMVFAGISDPQQRADLIAWLGTQK